MNILFHVLFWLILCVIIKINTVDIHLTDVLNIKFSYSLKEYLDNGFIHSNDFTITELFI